MSDIRQILKLIWFNWFVLKYDNDGEKSEGKIRAVADGVFTFGQRADGVI